LSCYFIRILFVNLSSSCHLRFASLCPKLFIILITMFTVHSRVFVSTARSVDLWEFLKVVLWKSSTEDGDNWKPIVVHWILLLTLYAHALTLTAGQWTLLYIIWYSYKYNNTQSFNCFQEGTLYYRLSFSTYWDRL